MASFTFREEDLIFNYQQLSTRTQARVIGVVKSNGYGLGLIRESRILLQAGCRMLAVADPREALALRDAGILCEILLLTPVYEAALLQTLITRRITLSLTGVEGALRAEQAAATLERRAEAHWLLDCGLGRHGFSLRDRGAILYAAGLLSKVTITGTFAHPASARRAPAQGERFLALCNDLVSHGLPLGMRHFCNSSAFFTCPHLHLEAVRIGSALLGCGRAGEAAGLRRVGELEGYVEDVYDRPRGSCIGYGRGSLLLHNTRVAVVSIGYRDGFALAHQVTLGSFLRRRPPVIYLHGQPCRVLGRVGCSSSMVDVTGLPCRAGDRVTARINPLLSRGEAL